MLLRSLIYSSLCVLMCSCASQQQATSNGNEVKRSEVTVHTSAPASEESMTAIELQEQADNLKMKSDLLTFERDNFRMEKERFEEKKKAVVTSLEEREAIVTQQEKDIAQRSTQLDLKERIISQKLSELEKREAQLYNLSTPMPVMESSSVVPATNQSISNNLPTRYIQFVATIGGKPFDDLQYLGTIISEQVPGKDLYRYKVMGQFSDSEVDAIIAKLKAHGYSGAFEPK